MLEPRDLRMHHEELAKEAFELYVKDLGDGELSDMLFAESNHKTYAGLPTLSPYLRALRGTHVVKASKQELDRLFEIAWEKG